MERNSVKDVARLKAKQQILSRRSLRLSARRAEERNGD